jgi:cytoskeletal protein CcmA (bactofilin family)
VISPGVCLTGNLESPGEVQIEGEVQGDVQAGRIVVGSQGFIHGTLIADEIIVGGGVQGSIMGNQVTFQSGSHVEGDVAHRSLSIEQGAYFEGKSRRVENPTAR